MLWFASHVCSGYTLISARDIDAPWLLSESEYLRGDCSGRSAITCTLLGKKLRKPKKQVNLSFSNNLKPQLSLFVSYETMRQIQRQVAFFFFISKNAQKCSILFLNKNPSYPVSFRIRPISNTHTYPHQQYPYIPPSAIPIHTPISNTHTYPHQQYPYIPKA